MKPRFPDALPASPRWVTRLPYVTLALFVAIIAALVWLTRSHDQEEQRATLINDVLWMEQNLQFLLDRNSAMLSHLGPELLAAGGPSPEVDATLRQTLRSASGLVQVLWLDAAGQVRGAMPPPADAAQSEAIALAPPAESSFRLARATGRRTYSPAYPTTGGGYQFEVHVPVHAEGRFVGVAVAVYSLQELLARELPWWFSERYRVAIVDNEGYEIAAKSKVAPLSNERQYTMAFDPPGNGLSLQITAYKSETRWVPVLLIASITLLALIIVWSIWQLRRQLVRRQAAEQALRSESLFRRAMEDSLLTGLRARDRSGRITYVNPAFCRMVGYSADELIGLAPPLPYWDPEHLERIQEIHDQVLAKGTPPDGVELRLRRKNGERLDALIFESPLIDADGQHTGWMGSMLDITEQKRARELARQQEERLQATSRLVTMGEMASTLAHELNQPLAAIATYNTGCLNRLEADAIDRAELREIHTRLARQARRAGDIIRRVHDFVRRSEPKREPLDVNSIVRDSVGLVEADARKRRMRIDAQLASDLPTICADPVMIEQVIINLVRNGMDAMRDTPRERRILTIETRAENGQLLVRVTDRGCGIPPETAKRLFEPFFTTKSEGMGMGLNICRSIAELHRGRLGFETNPDGGTIFTLSLPVELS